jgi:2-keto-4-pentenoate hydratase
MPTASIQDAIARLLQAHRTGVAQPAPGLPDAASAYAVQAGVAQALGWFDGAATGHWKSGGGSRAAVLAEIALRLGADVDAARAATLDLAASRALVDAMCVAIEVVDTRWAEGFAASGPDKTADAQVNGGLVLGPWLPFEAERDWAAQACRVQWGDTPARDFTGTHPLGEPAWGLAAWLQHATRDGAVVPAGTVVTTGTWCGLLQAQAGQRVVVSFAGLGEVSVQF